LSKDAIKEFDCCSLSLQPCRNPVITPDGWIYEKEAILEYILHKKMENAKLLKQFAKQKDQKNKDLAELADIEQKEKLEKFLKTEGNHNFQTIKLLPFNSNPKRIFVNF
jgi:nitric oxide synthase-interacting protein